MCAVPPQTQLSPWRMITVRVTRSFSLMLFWSLGWKSVATRQSVSEVIPVTPPHNFIHSALFDKLPLTFMSNLPSKTFTVCHCWSFRFSHSAILGAKAERAQFGSVFLFQIYKIHRHRGCRKVTQQRRPRQ